MQRLYNFGVVLLLCVVQFCTTKEYDLRSVNLLKWVAFDQIRQEQLIPAGRELQNGVAVTTYVARANVIATNKSSNNRTATAAIPGKWDMIQQHRGMKYGEGNVTQTSTDFDVLLAPAGVTSWVPKDCAGSYVLGGTDPETGNNLFICRITVSKHDSVVVSGKLTDLEQCIVPIDGHETIATDDFEILAFNAFGEAIMAQEGNTDDPD